MTLIPEGGEEEHGGGGEEGKGYFLGRPLFRFFVGGGVIDTPALKTPPLSSCLPDPFVLPPAPPPAPPRS